MKRQSPVMLLIAWALVGAGGCAMVTATPAPHEGTRSNASIPPGHLPPPGTCRVWYDDRPPGRQPPPTSCGEARREAYRTGGRVIYGGEKRDR